MSDWTGSGTPIAPPGAGALTASTLINDLDLTALPLDTFRQIMGVDPWHFWQMSTPTGCSSVYTHYRWLGDGYVARHDFIQAIVMAEQTLARKLEFWPGLRYQENEIVRLIVPRQPVLYNRTPMKIHVDWHRVQQVGRRTWALLGSVAMATLYTASEDVTITIAGLPAGTIASEIVVCYTGTQVQIRPIQVTVSGAVATINIKRWLMGDPDLWSVGTVIDPSDNDNLLALVDVYRVTYDTSHAITLAWEPEIQMCGCLTDSCNVCAGATQSACASRGDWANGLIGWQAANYAAGVWTPATLPWSRYPDMSYVSYLHGANPDPDRYMSMFWAQIVSHMAVALMDEAGCGCSDTMSAMLYWKEDLAYSKDSSHQLGPMDIDNPFGQRRGQISAWKAVLMQAGEE